MNAVKSSADKNNRKWSDLIVCTSSVSMIIKRNKRYFQETTNWNTDSRLKCCCVKCKNISLSQSFCWWWRHFLFSHFSHIVLQREPARMWSWSGELHRWVESVCNYKNTRIHSSAAKFLHCSLFISALSGFIVLAGLYGYGLRAAQELMELFSLFQLMMPALRRRCITTLWSAPPTFALWPSAVWCSTTPSPPWAAAPPAAPPSSLACRRWTRTHKWLAAVHEGKIIRCVFAFFSAPERHVWPTSGCSPFQLVWRSAESPSAPRPSRHTHRWITQTFWKVE